jgi:hypothetical protein
MDEENYTDYHWRKNIIDRAEFEMLARRAAVNRMAQRDSEGAARRNTATAAVALGLIAMAMLLVTLWRTW